MKYSFKGNLSTKGIRDILRGLDNYRDTILPDKCYLFMQRLAEKGIEVAYYSMDSEFAPCVEFHYEFVGRDINKSEGMLVGKTTKFIHRVWYKPNGEESGSYDISPLAMAEFGAGWYASTNPWDSVPSTRGSLGKNGLKSVWYWYDENGVKHSSEEDHTINPTHPMYRAFQQMMNECENVAHEVFGYGE